MFDIGTEALTVRQLSPFETAATTRLRNHWKLVGPSDAGLHPSQHLESYSPQIRNPFRYNKFVNRSSQCWTFKPVRGHLKTIFPITGASEDSSAENRLDLDQYRGGLVQPCLEDP